MTPGAVDRTDRAVRKFSPKGVPVRLHEPAALADPAVFTSIIRWAIRDDDQLEKTPQGRCSSAR